MFIYGMPTDLFIIINLKLHDGMKDFFDPNIEGKKSAQSAVSTAKRNLLKKFEKELKEECEKHH